LGVFDHTQGSALFVVILLAAEFRQLEAQAHLFFSTSRNGVQSLLRAISDSATKVKIWGHGRAMVYFSWIWEADE